MIDIKKYIKVVTLLLISIISVVTIVNVFISNMVYVFGVIVNSLVALLVLTILFSMIITYRVVKENKVNSIIMKINFKITSLLFNLILYIASNMNIPKDEIRKVYVKLNNEYIYSNEYNFETKDILILIPHCVQKSICKLKVTSNINNCKECGMCNISSLLKLKEKTNVSIYVATGGTLARKIILENKPKAVIAVACERDLTSGVQDIRKIPILGVFNQRPNGPCIDTTINIDEIEKTIEFFEGKNKK